MEPNQQPTEEMPVQQAGSDGPTMQWESPEYLSSTKTPLWFIVFWTVVAALMAAAAFLIKSWSFAILIPVMAAALMMYTHRPARNMQYVVSAKGLYINDQLHPVAEFRSFGVLQEEAMPALLFIPTKRFRPAITVYFPAEIGEQLVDFLAVRLPMQEAKFDFFDRLVHKLHL